MLQQRLVDAFLGVIGRAHRLRLPRGGRYPTTQCSDTTVSNRRNRPCFAFSWTSRGSQSLVRLSASRRHSQVVSLAKRWLLGTHQGSVDEAHLASYLNEFVFRFNRRRSRSRGMVFYRVLELAVAHDPVRYQDLIATKRPRAVPPTPPQARGHPPSLERPPANRPWRTTGLDSSG